MGIVRMALRNLGRNRRRTILAASSTGIAIMLVLILNGMIGGFMGSIVKNYTKNDVGHINVTTKEYRERERFSPVDAAIADSASIAQAIRNIPELEGALVTERIRFGVVLSSDSGSKAALCMAGELETEKSLLMLDRSVSEGRYPSAPGETILGWALARDLGLGLGDSLKVQTEKSDSGIGYKKFTIVGIFITGVNTLDNAVFQIGLDDARSLLALEGSAQQILVMLKNYRNADRAAALIETAITETASVGGKQELSVKPWTQMGDFPRFVIMAESIYFWMYLAVAFLGAFIITNIMMMVVLERRKEIGLLKSMGMSNAKLLLLFLTEGCLMGTLGSIFGTAFGLMVNIVMSKVGFDMSSAMASFAWPMDNIVYFSVNPYWTLGILLLGIIVSAVVSIAPARSAAIMRPIDAIRSV